MLVICAFAVPIAGPLRASPHHLLIAAGVIAGGIGIGLLIAAGGTRLRTESP
ncbi:MAG TPA: hypothetical protein VFB58_08970 [Chloroflexota bacterium]|nr:hypothetical protein [Chloroflexota bacterium]